jgi:hypothetical protein
LGSMEVIRVKWVHKGRTLIHWTDDLVRRDTRDLSLQGTQRKRSPLAARTQEDGLLHIRKRGLTRDQCLILTLWPPELGEISIYCESHSVYGILLRQP